METKEIFMEALKETLPDAVKTAVESETKTLSNDVASVKTDIADVKTQLAEIAQKAKFGSWDNEVKTLHKITADYFKALVKKDEKAFIEAKATFLNAGTDSEWGYMVPNEFAREVIRVAKDVGFARKYCRIIPMSTDTKDITTLVNGVTVYWKSEGVAYTGSKPDFWRVQLIAQKLTALVSGTNELIDDNQTDEEIFNLVRYLIGEALAEFEDTQTLAGNGTAPNFAGVSTVAGTVTGTWTLAAPTYSQLTTIKNKLPLRYRKNASAVWVVNTNTYTKIEALSDVNGRPLLKESIKNDADEIRLLGYPLEVNDALPDNKIVFGNFDYFLIGDRMNLVFEAGYATGGWESDIQSLKASERIAGKCAIPWAFVVATGA